MSTHGYDSKRFPLTAAQGRVLYHIERVFRSTGHGIKAHAAYIAACERAGLDPAHVDRWTLAECVTGLRLVEWAARATRLDLFRPCDTGWRDFLPSRQNVRELRA